MDDTKRHRLQFRTPQENTNQEVNSRHKVNKSYIE